MNVRATAKFVGTSPRKIGLVAALIRGRKAADAAEVLRQANKGATVPVGKVLNAAVSNAENNYSLSAKNLTVDSVLVGPGPTLKRFRPRAKGAASSIRKRTSHITVVLSDNAAAKASASQTKVTPEAEAKPETKPQTTKEKK
jgi:large subunit ribosomal protein L22